MNGRVVYQYVDSANWKKVERIVEGADPASLTVFGFSGVYAKDEANVFLQGKLIPEADPQSFEVLEDLYKYAKDNRYLFCSTKKIGKISDGFEYLGGGFAKNDRQAFNQGKVIVGAVGKTFELMDEKGLFARDHQSVFCTGKKLEGAHAASFHKLKFQYYADQNFVYYLSHKLENSNANDFEFFGDRYSKSGNNVYYRDKLIAEADAQSFKVISGKDGTYLAQDKNHKYRGGRKVD